MKALLLFTLALAISSSLHGSLKDLALSGDTVVSGSIITKNSVEFFKNGTAPIDEHSLFEVGSITKVFTALAVSQYETKNPGFIDRPIRELISGINSSSLGDVTGRELATHTSGFSRLPPSMGLFYILLNFKDPYRTYSRANLIKDLNRSKLKTERGRFEYSNYGYATLGRALETVSGRRYEDIIKHDILNPLGMTQSFIHYSKANEGTVTPGYGESGKPTSFWRQDAIAPAGSLKSSARDLSRFLSSYFELGEDTLSQAMKRSLEPQVEVNKQHSVALGWQIRNHKRGPIYWHNGGTGGFRSFIAFLPNETKGVVLLSNFAGIQDLDKKGFELLIAPPASSTAQ
ncbi:MAG: serine hydrolase domain-containing protein [Verrucomicrobiota bacterium]